MADDLHNDYFTQDRLTQRMAGTAIDGTVKILCFAGLVGIVAGIGSVATTPQGWTTMTQAANNVAIAAGIKRGRDPEVGDHWNGCNEARAAGSAPIYRSEPGYRSEMDGDGDGIACEPKPD